MGQDQEQSKGMKIAFWVITGLIVLTQTASGIGDLLGVEGLVKGVTDLGFPRYILYILGPCKIAACGIIAAPGLKRLKEWAYAGLTIDFLGGFASHLFAGEGFGKAAPALVATVLLLTSYWLRPADRKL